MENSTQRVLRELGGFAAVSRELGLDGFQITRQAIIQWAKRDVIGPEFRLAVVALCQRKRVRFLYHADLGKAYRDALRVADYGRTATAA